MDIRRVDGYNLEKNRHEAKVMEHQIAERKVFAFRKIHTVFKEIIKDDKCLYCTCFQGDVLDKVHDTLKRFNESEPEHRLNDIEADFERWAKDVDPLKAHG